MISKSLLPYLIIIIILSSCGSVKKPYQESTFSIKTGFTNFPLPSGYINDFENILTASEEKKLAKLIRAQQARTQDQIVVVTVASIEPFEQLDDYARGLIYYWGVGEKVDRKGILIALGKDLRRVRIENGAGIVKRLTDAETQQIIDEIIIPEFKEEQFFQGLKNGLRAIFEELK